MQAKERSDDEPLSPDASEEELPSVRKEKSKSKRRFSDEQVRSLETIFESEAKLEPRKKVQVARELGLHPRQVAIWFQNKRARWKSKQIEKNYRLLKANFDSLKARFEVMRKEKDSLLLQLQELRSLVDKSQERSSNYKDYVANNNNEYRSRENGMITFAGLQTKSSNLKREMIDQQGVVYSDEDKTQSMAYLYQQEESELLNISENFSNGSTSMISPAKWCSFDAVGDLFDQSNNCFQWWGSWT